MREALKERRLPLPAQVEALKTGMGGLRIE